MYALILKDTQLVKIWCDKKELVSLFLIENI